ncbi:MAG: hypothetical protein JXA77_15965 [Bacteroidales bacterium]|nr:hypothetical protein [Bacteroidales bacterium]MBN2817481.1 hypothetical protein [Bacteroidales bacterium]
MKLKTIFFGCLYLISTICSAQPVPAGDENIPYLMTFGNEAETSWGDDDFSQTFFFLIPETFKEPVFVRVFDPDIGGDVDEQNGTWDTRVTYSIYGGSICYSDKDAMETDPVGNYKSGNLLASKTFMQNPRYDNNWYTFGPFNPTEGEFVAKFGGYVIKIIADGEAGNDGNLYRYFLSTSSTENKPVEGGNAFAFEYSFRMHDDPNQISHIYPYVDDRTISVKLSNFDWDMDGFIRTVSIARRGQMSKISSDNSWVSDEFKIFDEEKNTSLDIQFIKKKTPPVKNNNVVVNVRNQYNELLPFYVLPIGGVPKYKYSINATRVNE